MNILYLPNEAARSMHGHTVSNQGTATGRVIVSIELQEAPSQLQKFRNNLANSFVPLISYNHFFIAKFIQAAQKNHPPAKHDRENPEQRILKAFLQGKFPEPGAYQGQTSSNRKWRTKSWAKKHSKLSCKTPPAET